MREASFAFGKFDGDFLCTKKELVGVEQTEKDVDNHDKDLLLVDESDPVCSLCMPEPSTIEFLPASFLTASVQTAAAATTDASTVSADSSSATDSLAKYASDKELLKAAKSFFAQHSTE